MTPDTFYTMSYKGCFIHVHHDRDKKREVFRVVTPSGHSYEAKTLHSAKYRITAFWSKK